MAAALIAAGACSWKPGGDPGTLTVLLEFPPDTLDPRYAVSAYSKKICRLIFSGLVRIGDDMRPVPDLAERLDSPDPTTYIATLRAGLAFHDGSPLTSADVKHTYESMKDPESGSPYQGLYARIVRVETPDPRTAVFRLDGPHAPFPADLIIGIVPSGTPPAPRGAQAARPPGSGPFRFVSWEREDELVLARNTGHHRGAPVPERLIFRTLRDDNTRLLSLITGGADIMQNAVPPVLAGSLRGDGRIAVQSSPSSIYTYIGFNLEDPILRDPAVRKAVATAIDRDALISRKLMGMAVKAAGILPPGHWAYEGDVERHPFDPEAAKTMLDRAGYPDPDGPGPSKRFALIYKTSTNKFRMSVARAVAAYLEDVGIGVEVRPYEFGTFFQDIKSGNFQMFSMQWTDVFEPDIFRYVFHSKSIPASAGGGESATGANRGRYRNTELDALLDAGRTEQDQAGRREIYSKVQKILARDLPYVSLWHEDNVIVARLGVSGYWTNRNADFDGLAAVSKR